jgi:uncharacterized protein YbcV (DUF1398 family)
MFTIQQIKEAHSQVKSGADFPNYVQKLIEFGVERYESFVEDGHSLYYGSGGYTTHSDAKYPPLPIALFSNKTNFQKGLKEHQQGLTDYMTFCRHCAESGVEKWLVDMAKMTCTYYDKSGNELLVETIPTL